MAGTHEHSDDEHVGVAAEHRAGTYLYRPGEILVSGDQGDVVSQLLGDQVLPPPAKSESGALTRLRLTAGTEREVSRVIEQVRASRGGARLTVFPNHVMTLTSHVMFAPGLPPRPADPVSEAHGDGTIKVGVIDSGLAYDPSGDTVHPWFGARCNGDTESLPAPGSAPLPAQAGHGTFVAGVVLQHAPDAKVVVRSAHDEHGVIDDLQLADALRRLVDDDDVDIINLSLGGYTHDDMGFVALPLALREARATKPDLIVVAAAGNHATTRPFFPAAFKDVIAVGATDGDGAPACFTNRGWWVDANATGTDVHSTFVMWDGPREPFLNVPSRCYQAAHDAMAAGNTFKGFAHWSGTSFAAPKVTAALVKELANHGDAQKAVDTVVRTAPTRVPDLGAVVP